MQLNVGVIITIVIQTVSVVWYLAQIDAVVKQHSVQISELKSNSAVYLSREQFNDLIAAPNQRMDNIEMSLDRIETKLDKVIP